MMKTLLTSGAPTQGPPVMQPFPNKVNEERGEPAVSREEFDQLKKMVHKLVKTTEE